MKPHKHYDTIVAWAAGQPIQYKNFKGEWEDMSSTMPNWDGNCEFRVKPAEPERKRLETTLTDDELRGQWAFSTNRVFDNRDIFLMRHIANAALRHACDNGQIVTREEFDRAVGDRAKRDLDVARAVNQVVAKSGGLPDDHLIAIIKGVTQ